MNYFAGKRKMKNRKFIGSILSLNLSLSLSLSFMLVFCSCEKEYEKHCERQGSADQICKELRYENDVLVEAVSYEYGNNGLVSLKLHENKSGKNIGQVIYTYDSQNKLVSENYKDSDKDILIANSWTYNEQLQVKLAVSDVFGVKQESHFTYTDKLVEEEKIYIDGQLKFSNTHKYYENDSISYDVFTYDGAGVLVFVNEYRQFDFSTMRIETYDALGDLSGYVVQLFDTDGELTQVRTYDIRGNLLNQEEYQYDNGIIKEYRFLSALKPNKKTTYLRFN